MSEQRVAVGGSGDHLEGEAAFDPTAGGAGSLPGSWERHFAASPDRPALESASGGLSYGELERASRAAAGRLAALGLVRGDRLLVSAESCAELVVAVVGALRMGLVLVPANTAYREAEIDHVVADAGPRAALVDDAERVGWLRAADAALVVCGPEVEGEPAEAPPLAPPPAGAPALIGYTSGTTGRPKGAVLSHGNLLASAEALRRAWRWVPSDRLLLALPLFHMHGLGVGLFGSLHAGASVRLWPRFDPDLLFAAIRSGEGTLFFGVPTMYHRLVDHPEADALSRLRLCVSGSAPLPGDLHRRFEARTGQRILERYGMTETVMLVSNPHDGERRPGSVGLPLPGVEVRLAGEPGEIEVRGPNVFSGYWQRPDAPDANASAFTEDGWFRTGDLGRRDEAGYLEICGRAKELVISGGYNVYPREVEDAVRLHPGVSDVAVVGVASAEWGETVTAYLVGAVGEALPGLDDLHAFLADRLARYKWPRRLHVVPELPRNALGKVQKHRLSEGRVLPEER